MQYYESFGKRWGKQTKMLVCMATDWSRRLPRDLGADYRQLYPDNQRSSELCLDIRDADMDGFVH
jgi:hypothetical protein